MDPEIRMQKFMAFMDAIGKIKLAVSEDQQNKLIEIGAKAVKACDAEAHAGEFCDVITGLISDRYWEPVENGAGCSEGAQFIVERACNHSADEYINMAMQLWGDRPAASLSWKMIANAAHYHFKLDLRNAIRPVLEEWRLLPGKEEDL